ncbi:protein NRT1/ PTR FAMILY 2.3-like protein [Carex littledalei]|uniref:Protein NRT1/ PTR FAMILY 2.3-like protein n=1 Tax=Carex littledalei TaxID=544730 RepID=A0A833R6U4_9POAL|nr:protein NRT1/ PTR FAMILY 2.3-like protein [Carex littledalei]
MATKMASEKSKFDEEKADKSSHRQGGWITFPFLSGSILGVGLAMSGAMSNFLVYLIQEYNVRSIDAAQIVNIISGSLSLAPVAGAIVADAFFGCYSVVAASSAIQLLSLVLFTMTAALKSLRPTPCDVPGTDSCQAASKGQLTVLYSAVALLAIATGGTRFNQATMGASQFDRVEDQAVYFNWFFIFMYISSIVGATAIVYIQDSISWVLGFGLSLGASAVSLVVLLLGTKYYRRPAPQGSPFTGLFRVIVATVRKWKLKLSQATPSYFHGNDDIASPSLSFSLFNRAALISEGDTNQDGSIAKPWKLCTVREVEDFKAVVRVLPVWASAIFLSISIGCQINLSVLQALTMDRSIGPSFSIPAGSMTVPGFLAFVIFLTFLDRILFPIWLKLTHHTPTPLQRIGIGHFINVVSMIASALVERRRAAVISRHQAEVHPGWIVPMSALWLVLPLALQGSAEALHFPGQVALYYQEFPKALKNTSTGMEAVIIAFGFYLSTAFLSILRHMTTWLPDDLNRSRLENVYWLIAILATINFGIYIICAKFYKYQNSVDTEKVAASEISAS